MRRRRRYADPWYAAHRTEILAARQSRWTTQHSGHDITIGPRGWRHCHTCDTQQQRRNDVDPVAVERAVAGDAPTRMSPAEREAVVDQLARRSVTNAEIARRLRVTPQTVGAIRTRIAA